MVVFGPIGFCLQYRRQVCLLTCAWFLLSSSGCGLSIFFTIFTRHFVSLWLLFFSISCIWFFFPGVDCHLFAVILHFFVLVSFYCVFTLLWSVYNSLQLVCFFVVILSVCDFLFIFCYLVVIVAVLLNLQFILVILHLFVAAWGLTSVSLFWRFCNFCCYCVFSVSLWLMCVSLYWIRFPFVDFWLLVFFGPFVPFWCNFTFLCSCLMCLSMKTDDSHSTVNRGSDSETSYLPLSLHACIYSIKKAAFHPDHTSEVELMMMIETWNSTAEMLCVCSV